jgi:hypothetical protein
MREAGEDHLFQRPCLGRDGRADARLGMAEQVGLPTGDSVEITTTIMAYQPAAFAAGNRYQWQFAGEVFAHLRARVPEHVQVARTPALRLGCAYHCGKAGILLHTRIIAAFAGSR